MAEEVKRKEGLTGKANRPRKDSGRKRHEGAKILRSQEVEMDRARFHHGVQMDIDGVKEGKESQGFLASALRMLKAVIGENPVVHPLGGSAFIIDSLPFVRTARNRGEEAKVVSMAKIDGFAVRSGAADVGVRAIGDAAEDAGSAEFGTELIAFKAPVDHLVTVRADGDAVF